MDNITQELNNKAKFFTTYLWYKELDIPIKINKRFRSTEGQYLTSRSKPICIDIANNILYDEFITEDVLLHELCHWYCHISGKDYRDNTKYFEDELENIGASSTNSTIDKDGKVLYKYNKGCYRCSICNSEFETEDYLELQNKSELGGTPVKKYTCCNEYMNFTGISHDYKDFKPNEKLLKIHNAYKNTIK